MNHSTKIPCSVCGVPFWPRSGKTHHAKCSPDKARGLKILVIPDTQTKPGVPLEHLEWAGKYAVYKRPDVIVHLGDHWDLPSLSTYDKGKRGFEGRRLKADLAAGNRGMRLLMNPIRAAKGYDPRLIFLLGNHEWRLQRAIDMTAELEGVLSYPGDFDLEGWEVIPFLKVIEVGGVEFSHYFCSGAKNGAVSSAASLLRERQGSAIQGHNQIFQIATHPRTNAMAIFAGAFYQHEEEYLTKQGQDHRRQLLMLHETKDGLFDLMMVSLDFLKRRYGK